MDTKKIDELYWTILKDPANLRKVASLSSGFNLVEVIREFEKGKLGQGYLHNLDELKKAAIIATKLFGADYLRHLVITMVNNPKDYELNANSNQVAKHWIMNLRAIYKRTLRDKNFIINQPELLLGTIGYFFYYQQPIKGYAEEALRNIGTPEALSFLEKIE